MLIPCDLGTIYRIDYVVDVDDDDDDDDTVIIPYSLISLLHYDQSSAMHRALFSSFIHFHSFQNRSVQLSTCNHCQVIVSGREVRSRGRAIAVQETR